MSKLRTKENQYYCKQCETHFYTRTPKRCNQCNSRQWNKEKNIPISAESSFNVQNIENVQSIEEWFREQAEQGHHKRAGTNTRTGKIYVYKDGKIIDTTFSRQELDEIQNNY